MPKLYQELFDIRTKLEQHYRDMQDIEFTIQEGKLYMLQCRNGKRTGTAAPEYGDGHAGRRAYRRELAVMRVQPAQLDELLHPIVNPAPRKRRKRSSAACRPVPAGPAGRSSSPPPPP